MSKKKKKLEVMMELLNQYRQLGTNINEIVTEHEEQAAIPEVWEYTDQHGNITTAAGAALAVMLTSAHELVKDLREFDLDASDRSFHLQLERDQLKNDLERQFNEFNDIIAGLVKIYAKR